MLTCYSRHNTNHVDMGQYGLGSPEEVHVEHGEGQNEENGIQEKGDQNSCYP